MNMLKVSPGVLRLLLAFEVGSVTIGAVLSIALESSLPEPLRDYLASVAEAEATGAEWLVAGAGVVLLCLYMISLIGLWFFWPPARGMYLATTLAGFALYPFFGPTVEDGWSALCGDLAMFLAGVVLAVIYWTPLAERLARKPELQDTPVA